MENEITPTKKSAGIGRRGVLTAAAWSAPVIAVAVASPVHAVSGVVVGKVTMVWSNPSVGTDGAGKATSYSGDLTITVPKDQTIVELTITAVNGPGDSGTAATGVTTPANWTLVSAVGNVAKYKIATLTLAGSPHVLSFTTTINAADVLNKTVTASFKSKETTTPVVEIGYSTFPPAP